MPSFPATTALVNCVNHMVTLHLILKPPILMYRGNERLSYSTLEISFSAQSPRIDRELFCSATVRGTHRGVDCSYTITSRKGLTDLPAKLLDHLTSLEACLIRAGVIGGG